MTDRTPPLEGQILQTVVNLDSYDAVSDRFVTDNLDEAQVITSLVAGKEKRFQSPSTDETVLRGRHKVVLDIDLPAKLIPSSTEGHFHLYIDHEIEHDAYMKLLDVMCEVGLLEVGYVRASEERGHTAARLPWVKKPEPALGAPAVMDDDILRMFG